MIKNWYWSKKSIFSPVKDKRIEFILIQDNKDTVNLEVKRNIDVIPDWYKKMPSKFIYKGVDDLSLKKCVPFLDAISSGYSLVTTEDVFFKKNENGTFEFSGHNLPTALDGNFGITSHPIDQLSGMPIGKEYLEYAFKWMSPWLIKTPKKYSVLFFHPLNMNHLPFQSLSGFVDTDKFPLTVQFPFLMKNNFEGKIPAGTPIIQIIPIKREKWIFKIFKNPSHKYIHNAKNVTNEYLEGQQQNGIPVGGTYKKKYREKKDYL